MRRKLMLLMGTVIVIVGWFLATIAGDNRPVLGLDLQGGTSIVLTPKPGSDKSTLDTAIAIIRNRVDGLGVAEPDVSRSGDNVTIDLPGVKNSAQADKVVGETAELRFRLVQGEEPFGPSTAPTTSSTPSTAAANGTTTTISGATSTTGKHETSTTLKKALSAQHINAQPIAAVRPEAGGPTSTVKAPTSTTATTKPGSTTTTTVNKDPAAGTCHDGKDATKGDPRDKPVILPDLHKTSCLALGATIMDGRSVKTAVKTIDPNNAGWIVDVTFKNDDFLNKIAKQYVNKRVAMELDGVVQSSPTINPGITGRNVTISGNFSEKEAGQLALVLRYGSLPVQFNQSTAVTVSPSLGKDQLHAGIVSGLIGLILVAIYMIFFYRVLGLVVWTGIALTGLTFFSLVSYLSQHQGLTLTLAGVTGIIVSVGVTVDSYVVYFERLKDEVRTGKTVRSSLDSGFRRAYRTIIAADFVSLLGAIVLYSLAAGSVRGFAYFLGLSTLLDLILAYCFMWPFVSVLARSPKLVRMRGVGIGAGLDVPEVRA